MATIRRVLIAIVGLLLIVDAAALAYVKFTSGPAPSEEKSKLVLWIDNGEQAKAAAAMLKEHEYEAVLAPAPRESEVEADFRVVMKGNEKLLKSVSEILRQGGHKELSFSSDKTKLYYGGYYKQKAQALRAAERIKAKEQLVFEVAPGTKVVKKPSHKLVVASMPSNMVEGVLEDLKEQKVELNDHVETSLEPKPEAEPTEEEE